MIKLDINKTKEKISKLLIECNVSPIVLSNELNVSKTTIYKWINKANLPSLCNIVELSNILSLPLREFVIFEK